MPGGKGDDDFKMRQNVGWRGERTNFTKGGKGGGKENREGGNLHFYSICVGEKDPYIPAEKRSMNDHPS
jgi:hypothetical protein